MLDEKFYEETYDMFIENFGNVSQMRMCIEEMSELIKELCKFIRYSENEDNEENRKILEQIRKNIVEETADVLICASQMKKIYGEKEVEEMMDYKIQRGRKRVEAYIAKNGVK